MQRAIDGCHAEVLRSIWPDYASKPDPSEYLSMTDQPLDRHDFPFTISCNSTTRSSSCLSSLSTSTRPRLMKYLSSSTDG